MDFALIVFVLCGLPLVIGFFAAREIEKTKRVEMELELERLKAKREG